MIVKASACLLKSLFRIWCPFWNDPFKWLYDTALPWVDHIERVGARPIAGQHNSALASYWMPLNMDKTVSYLHAKKYLNSCVPVLCSAIELMSWDRGSSLNNVYCYSMLSNEPSWDRKIGANSKLDFGAKPLFLCFFLLPKVKYKNYLKLVETE